MVAPAARATSRTLAYQTGAAMLFLTAAVILGALGFEHFGGQLPCPLCLQQRYAYYAGIPLLFGALVLLSAEQDDDKPWAALVFLAVAFLFLANAGLGVYHAGVEWKLWDGPTTCAIVQPISGSAGGLLKQLENNVPVRCDEASWRFLGLSLAGWNVVVSLIIFAGSLRAAFAAAPQKRYI